VELYNKTTVSVSIKNWKLCVGTTCKSIPDVSIPADSFLVLTSMTAMAMFPAEVNVVGISSFPALTNTGQMLQLLNAEGNIISVISYTDNWYQDTFKKNGGYSLEQIDAGNPCGGMDNWKASVDKTGGTPGKKNSVAGTHADNIQPAIRQVSMQSSTELELYFSEAMDSMTLFDKASYAITTIGNPIQVKATKPMYDRVQLTFGTALQEQTVYTLTVDRKPCDCAGNKIQENSHTQVAIPMEAKPMDIILNEVLFDPNPNGVDFVEIYNRSSKTIDLRTLFLCHFDSVQNLTSSVERITTDGCLFFPGTYLVLAENTNMVKQQYQTLDPNAFLQVAGLPVLNADKGDIGLKTTDKLIDFFCYDADMHFGLLKETKGISLERVSPEQATNKRTNWHSASSTVGFATPGFKNSQFVEATEATDAVKIFPETFTPDNDGIDDVVNLSYQLEEPGWSAGIFIYDMSGRLVKTIANNDLIATQGIYTWDGTNMERGKETIGVYLIFIQFFNLSGKVKAYKKICVLSGKN
jgi:hypothetical protein